MIFSKLRAIFIMIEFVFTVFLTIIFMYIFRKKHRKVRQIWAKSQKHFMGYKIISKGQIDTSANLILINHQSLVDIVVLEDLHPQDLCWIAKKEIQNIPLFGHIMKAPYMISVQRDDKRSLIGLLKDAKDRIGKKRVIAIFPEGTRGDGKNILEFKNGARFLAEKLNLKIMPVVVVNSKNVFDSKKMLAKKGEVKVCFLPAFTPQPNTNWLEQLHANMQKVLDDELLDDSSNR